MNHQMKKVILVKGERIDYLCVLYLESGNRPKVVCRVRFPQDSTILAQRECTTLEDLEAVMETRSRIIADSFGYKMNVVPVPDGVYADQFLAHIGRGRVAVPEEAANAFLN